MDFICSIDCGEHWRRDCVYGFWFGGASLKHNVNGDGSAGDELDVWLWFLNTFGDNKDVDGCPGVEGFLKVWHRGCCRVLVLCSGVDSVSFHFLISKLVFSYKI